MTIRLFVFLLCSFGGCITSYAAEMSAEQHYAKGLSLLSENDGSNEVTPTQAGLLSAIAEFKKALEAGHPVKMDIRLALSKAYEICATATRSPNNPMSEKERNALECRKQGAILLKQMYEENPDNAKVVEQYAKFSAADKDMQLILYEKLVKASPGDSDARAQLAWLYLGKDKKKEAISQFREALVLTDDARLMSEYANNIAASLQALECPLTGMDELTSVAASMFRPPLGDQQETKKYTEDLMRLKKRIVEKIDSSWRMPGSCILAKSAMLTAEQHYEKGVLLLKENDIGSSSATQEGQLNAIVEFKSALELDLDYPNRGEAPILLSRAYELCALYDGRTKKANAKEKANAEKCNKENGKLVSDLVANFPLNPRVMERFENFVSKNPELQSSLNEMLAQEAESRAAVASVSWSKGRKEQSISELKAAIALAVAPQKVAQYANSIDGSLQAMGCPLPGLADMSANVQSIKLPQEADGPKAKEKFTSDFKTLKKQILENVDKHHCAK